MKPTATQIARDANRELAKVIDREAPPERIIKALADALEADMANRDGTRGPDLPCVPLSHPCSVRLTWTPDLTAVRT